MLIIIVPVHLADFKYVFWLSFLKLELVFFCEISLLKDLKRKSVRFTMYPYNLINNLKDIEPCNLYQEHWFTWDEDLRE